MRPFTRLKIAVVLALLVALLVPGAAQAAPKRCAAADAKPGEVSKRALVRSTVCLLNRERRQRGMRRLKLSSRLSRAAREHALDMARRNYFSHDSRSGASFVDRIRRAGYMSGARSWTVGENLAWGTGQRATPRATLRAWMNSPAHRANVLTRRFRHVGIGIAYDAPARVAGGPHATYASEFGAKR